MTRHVVVLDFTGTGLLRYTCFSCGQHRIAGTTLVQYPYMHGEEGKWAAALADFAAEHPHDEPTGHLVRTVLSQ